MHPNFVNATAQWFPYTSFRYGLHNIVLQLCQSTDVYPYGGWWDFTSFRSSGQRETRYVVYTKLQQSAYYYPLFPYSLPLC